MSVKGPLGFVLYCYFSMPTINKTYLILSLYIDEIDLVAGGLFVPNVSSAQYRLIDILVFITELYSS
jgi:hypothetical protein